MTNRVEAQVVLLRAAVARGEKVDGTGPIGDLEQLDRDLALAADEYVAFHETKSWAFVEGILTRDEALSVYAALGDPFEEDAPDPDPDNGGWAPGTDLALKVTVTNLMGQLLRMKLRRAGVGV